MTRVTLIGCIDQEQKNFTNHEGRGWTKLLRLLIFVKIGCEVTGVTVPHLVRFLKRYYRGLSKDALIRRVHRALDRLETEGLVTTEVVGRYRFARLTGAGFRELGRVVDLIKCLTSTKPTLETVLDDYFDGKVKSGSKARGGGVGNDQSRGEGSGVGSVQSRGVVSGEGSEQSRGEVKDIGIVIDRATRRAMKAVLKEFEERRALLRLIPSYRASKDWWIIAREIYTKPLDRVTDFDRERLGLTFEAWKEVVRDRVLLFLDGEDTIIAYPYRTRFTDERYVKELIWKYKVAWDVATLLFEDAVFVTITVPPIFPMKVTEYLLSFIRHRIKARLRKWCMKGGILFSKEIERIFERFSEVELEEMVEECEELLKEDNGGSKEVSDRLREFMKMARVRGVGEAMKVLGVLMKARKMKTPPHILGIEPQKSLAPHMHMIIFGVNRVMDKREFTLWLDELVIRFLREMGRHVKKTVNNKISEEEESYYNELGMRLMKKYSRYKRKNKGYRGPVNWITQLKRKEEIVEVNGKKKRRVYWEFANPPPDYLKYLEERMEKRLKEGKDEGFKIDWHGGPADYVKKYLIKNLKEILEEGLRNAGLIENGKDGGSGDKSGEKMEKSEMRELWERVGEELRTAVESSKGSEEVELKMVDDRKRSKKGRKRRGRSKKGESSWGSRVEVIKDERKRRLISSIKMGWYWLTRSPFYVVSPIFRVWSRRKKGGSGWKYLRTMDKGDLEMLEWLERKAGRGFDVIWLG